MYLLAGSALGLIMLAFGSWRLIEAILGTVYDNAFRDVLVSGGWTLTASAAIDAVVGGIVWVRFWVFGAFRSQRSSRRYGYALLGGVLGGFVAAVSAAGTIVFAVLQWWFGEPDSATAVGHFAQLPGAIGGLLVGLLVWFHHRSTIGLSSGSPVTETQSGRVETDRIYDYLIAFVALFVTAIASTLVMVAFIEAISAPRFVARSVSNSLVLAATFLVVGAPLFWIFWSRLQRTANVDHGEAQSLSRRVFLTVVLGLGAAVALGSLVGSLIVSFEDLVDGAVNSNTFYDMRVWFGLLFTAVASTMYFGSVQRVERARRVENNEAQEAVPPPLTPALVVITDLDVVAVAEALSNLVVVEELAIAGTGVRASDQALAALREELSLATCPRALVTLRDGEASWEPLIEIMRPT